MQQNKKCVNEQNTYRILLQKIKELKLWNEKSCLCKHPRGCVAHILYYSIRNFAMGYSFQSAINLVFLLMKFRKVSLIGLIKALISKYSFDSGVFAMLFILVQKIIFCSTRRIFRKENGISCFLAGFMAGIISLAYKQKENRANWSLFLLARSIDCIYTSLVKTKYKVKFDYILMFSLLNILPGYSFAVEPSLISRGLYNFYFINTNFDKGDAVMQNIWMKQKNLYFRKRGFQETNMNDFEIKY